MAPFQLVDLAGEDALNRSRLFTTEERAFKRITHRVLGPESLLTTNGKPPPPPRKKRKIAKKGTKDGGKEEEFVPRNPQEEFPRMRDDIILDFANFESSLIRMQLLLNSNEQERERYASEKVRIQATAQDVKNNTAMLRIQLDEAQKQLALRKEYDELAERIASNRLLKPRADQRANIEKLNNEIVELERESKEYAMTWAERREQFGKIIEEGLQLRRLIRDEKEEVERREGMEGRDEHDEGDAVSTRGRSNVGTPRPEAGGVTPLHTGSESDLNMLGPDKNSAYAKSPFRVSTPIPEETTLKPDGADLEDGTYERDGSVQEAVSSPSEGLVAEEGELDDNESTHGDDENRSAVDTMDMS